MTMHGSPKLATMVGVAAPLRGLMAAVLVGVGDAGLPTAAIAAKCAENTRNRDARRPYNVSCFLLQDFMDAYHPGEEFTWQRAANPGFGYLGTRQPDADTERQVYVNWQSFSDGLQWGFAETEITRRLAGDRYGVLTEGRVRWFTPAGEPVEDARRQ